MPAHLLHHAKSDCIVLLTLLSLAASAPVTAGEKSFAGFPPIHQHRPGERSLKVLPSDGVENVVRPKWTRAMTDLGGWPVMYRFRGTIYLVFPHVDGHRGKKLEGTGKFLCYASKDEGSTWEPQPDRECQYTPEYVVARDRLFQFDYTEDRQPFVRVSEDGTRFGEPHDTYKKLFFFWGVMYDPVSEMFWAPPHAHSGTGTGKERQIDLIRSKDGLNWELVSTVANYDNVSESTIHFEEDRTLVVIIRRKFGKTLTVAVAKPPYTEWDKTERSMIAEGEHFVTIGGEVFLGTRSNYAGDNPDVLNSPKLFDDRRSYTAVYQFTRDRQFVPRAVVDSAGDCSYPFLIETPTEILCAYYSQHEDHVCKVFLAGFDKAEFLKSR